MQTSTASETDAARATAYPYSQRELVAIRDEARKARHEYPTWTAKERADAATAWRSTAHDLLAAGHIGLSAMAKATAMIVDPLALPEPGTLLH